MADSHHTIEIDGCAIPLRVRRNKRARNLILRLDEDTGGAVVTIPNRTPIRDAILMAQGRAAWIAVQLQRLPQRVAFKDGVQIPFLGEIHAVRHQPGARGIRVQSGEMGPEIVVSGREEHLARRLQDWLKAQAKAEISAQVLDKTQHLASSALGPWGRPRAMRPGRITVRDTRSRWGSCAVDGSLNFSWRLILAPAFVLDYVVAHEVAHLAHRNHGPQFWALVEDLTSRTGEARAWLSAHGRSLHSYG
jgi:hypothetical protein